jgi:hypothetical protein
MTTPAQQQIRRHRAQSDRICAARPAAAEESPGVQIGGDARGCEELG